MKCATYTPTDLSILTSSLNSPLKPMLFKVELVS
jgi:hypothetical protein